MKRILLGLTIMTMVGAFPMNAQDYDDIYYNPKKDKTSSVKKSKKSNYIKDFENIDVDEYNRRGQYYSSPVDTIGSKAETDEDFIYTQQIQKYYNPTIVIDNADILADVLNNSYGNVDIVFENGNPFFMPSYTSPYYFNYYGWGSPWYNNWYWGTSWGPNWAWGPSWSWNWGPSWTWGPSWGWNWGPSWSWGSSWGWGPSWDWGHHHYADYRPGGRLPNRPGSNWASNTRPGGNNNHGMNSNTSRYPSSNIFGGSSVNHHRNYSNQTNSNSGSNKNSYNNSVSHQRGFTIGSDGHRRYNSSGTNNSTTNRNTTNSNNSNYHRSNSNNNYNNSYNSNSSRSNYNSSGFGGFSSGGNYGGGRPSGGGGARGRHR